MSSKTKIVVLHMKEVIYTVVFVVLGILLILLLTFMFLPNDEKHTSKKQEYMPGVYTSTVTFITLLWKWKLQWTAHTSTPSGSAIWMKQLQQCTR